MHCTAVKQRLVAWRDEELSPGEAVRVEEHLARCPSCRALEMRLAAVTPEPFLTVAPVSQAASDALARALDEVEDATEERSSEAPSAYSILDFSELAPHLAWAVVVMLCLGWGLSRHATALSLQAQLDAQGAPQESVLDGASFREASWAPPERQPETRTQPSSTEDGSAP
jgi:anti-sigma factor RsiW